MSFEQIKRAVAMLDEQQQAELISYVCNCGMGMMTTIAAKSPIEIQKKPIG